MSLWGKEGENPLFSLLTMNNKRISFWGIKYIQSVVLIQERCRNPLLLLLILALQTLFRIPMNQIVLCYFLCLYQAYLLSSLGPQESLLINSNNRVDLDILSKLLTPDINLLHQNSNNLVDWHEFVTNAGFSLSIAYLGIFIASFLYNLVYSYLQNFNFKNSFVKSVPNKNKIVFEKIKKCHICY